MADLDSTASLGEHAARVDERELRIEMHIDHWVQFEGTATQLQAEGVIPADFEWPQAAADVHWSANGFDFWLRRTRPEGHKGPMRSWLTLDNWFVRMQVSGRGYDWAVRRALERKTDELRVAYHHHTQAGQRELDANFNRYYATKLDGRFQAFKASIPGLVPPKRGRKPKVGLTSN